MALKHPCLSVLADGEGAMMEPIWKLLRSTSATETWNSDFRAALKSAIANRQWTQYRCWAAGWDMKHNKCLCCVHQCLDATPLIPTSVRGKLPKDHSAAHLATSDSTPRSASSPAVCGVGIAGPGEEEAMKRTMDDGDAESATLRSRDWGAASSSSATGLGHAGRGTTGGA